MAPIDVAHRSVVQDCQPNSVTFVHPAEQLETTLLSFKKSADRNSAGIDPVTPAEPTATQPGGMSAISVAVVDDGRLELGPSLPDNHAHDLSGGSCTRAAYRPDCDAR